MDTSTNSYSAYNRLLDAADTFAKKNSEYGENFRTLPNVMLSLFPNGITLETYEDWMRMQFLLLDIVKTTRYAQNFKNGGHKDSAHDKIVYAAMQENTDDEFNYFRTHRQSKPTNDSGGEPGDDGAKRVLGGSVPAQPHLG